MYILSMSQDSVADIVTKLWAGGSRALISVVGKRFSSAYILGEVCATLHSHSSLTLPPKLSLCC